MMGSKEEKSANLTMRFRQQRKVLLLEGLNLSDQIFFCKKLKIITNALTTNTIINLQLIKFLMMNKNELCRKFSLPFQGFNLHSPIHSSLIDWKQRLFLPHFNFCTQN
jgi:hypothetical protein